jgi:hypothetical protein
MGQFVQNRLADDLSRRIPGFPDVILHRPAVNGDDVGQVSILMGTLCQGPAAVKSQATRKTDLN